MYAVYAFCRIVDDIADEPAPLDEKLTRLAGWRARIAALYRGETDGPVTRVLLPAIRRFALPQPDFIAVIDGMQTDTEHEVIAPNLAELDLYCDQVAAAVGRLSVRAFGDSSAEADKVAWSLGRALQFTNILRDIAEDADRNRLYLPAEWLDNAGVPHDPRAALTSPGLPAVCDRMAAQAHSYFRDAARSMQRCDRRAMKPARLMGATYAAILSRLERRGWSRLDERASLPLWHKLWLAARYGLG
jgi:phytoene synthase